MEQDEQGNKSLKVTTLRAKSTLLVPQYNFKRVANGKFHDSPDVGEKVFNSDETERSTQKRLKRLKRLKRDFATHQKHFRDLDIA